MNLFRRLLGNPDEEPEEKSNPVTNPEESQNEAASNIEHDDTIQARPVDTEEVADMAPTGDDMDDLAQTTPLDENTQPQRTGIPKPTQELPSDPLPALAMDGATRPLAPEKVFSNKNENIVFGQSTDVGMVRSNNQDAMYSFFVSSRSVEERPDFGLFIVADGMGGHHDGERASAITARVVAGVVTKNIFLPLLNGLDDAERPPINEALIEAVQSANAEVLNVVPEGGTTLTAVAVMGNLAHIVHVGDSRVYLINDKSTEQITRDHSLVQRLIELDQLDPADAPNHPQANVLYRAIGQSENLEVDTLTRRLPPGSRLLLCSDGLWGQVHEDEISEIVTQNNPQEACDKLVALANTRGGKDNITAIILKVPN